MKWNVIVKDLSTGRIGSYNIFDCADFRIAVEKTIAQKYDKTRFLEELDREADYCFRAQIEWETFFTTWPPYIGAEEINRIIKEFYLNREQVVPMPERIEVNLETKHRIDVRRHKKYMPLSRNSGIPLQRKSTAPLKKSAVSISLSLIPTRTKMSVCISFRCMCRMATILCLSPQHRFGLLPE